MSSGNKLNHASVHGGRYQVSKFIDALDKEGLLIRVDGPINKDTELHPLVRWQFRGGISEKDRKAWLFTNVIDSKG